MRKKGFMTIGYGNMGIRDFIERIKKFRVNCIIDVRTRPYSKYNISFNKEELRDRLADEGISYFWFGNKLGGRHDKIKFCDEQGIVDYEKIAASESFIEAVKEVERMVPRYNICIMCSEGDPLKCHRFLLISRKLKEYNIHHILPDGGCIKNDDLEQQLFNMYGNVRQLSLFDDENESTFEESVYRQHSKKTAYISEKVKDLLAQGIIEDVPEKIKVFCIGTEGKNAEEFFCLLKEHKVRRIIDIRRIRDKGKSFATYPDIVYYLKLNCIEYERIGGLIPQEWMVYGYDQRDIKRYTFQITNNKSILGLLTEDLEGTCFLGKSEDYKYCYRDIIIKELRKHNKNITVRHLK